MPRVFPTERIAHGRRLLRCKISILAMTAWGQERRIGAVRNISALPPRADVGADIVEPPVSAKTGCEQSRQTAQLFNHLVGTLLKMKWHIEAERLGGFKINH